MTIQRYDFMRDDMEEDDDGVWVLYTDHATALAAEREKVAGWMTAHSYATGPGDSIDDLLGELSWQIQEQRDRLRAELAAVRERADRAEAALEGTQALVRDGTARERAVESSRGLVSGLGRQTVAPCMREHDGPAHRARLQACDRAGCAAGGCGLCLAVRFSRRARAHELVKLANDGALLDAVGGRARSRRRSKGEEMSDFNHLWLDRPYNELTDEQLKAVADWYQGWDDKQSHRACVNMMALRTERDALRERVARLVGAIEDAPHGLGCAHGTTDIWLNPNHCDCWKRTALGGKMSEVECTCKAADMPFGRCCKTFEPVAKVHINRAGGNAGIAWHAIGIDGSLPALAEGEVLYVLRTALEGK